MSKERIGEWGGEAIARLSASALASPATRTPKRPVEALAETTRPTLPFIDGRETREWIATVVWSRRPQLSDPTLAPRAEDARPLEDRRLAGRRVRAAAQQRPRPVDGERLREEGQ